jgi:2'-5' RNA ligase
VAGKWRAFVAIALPADIKTALGELQQRLRATGLKARWVRPENMHLTLKFLGDIDPSAAEGIEKAMQHAVDAEAPFSVAVAAVGVFPDPKRPRVLWVGLNDEDRRLLKLQQSLDEALSEIGFPREQRPFRGHLTLARFRDAGDRELLSHLLQEYHRIEIGQLTVAELILFRSDLRPSGPLYTRLAVRPLVASKKHS